jgi:hypothetical protein
MVARGELQHDRRDDDRDQRRVLEVDAEPQGVQRGVPVGSESGGSNRCRPRRRR